MDVDRIHFRDDIEIRWIWNDVDNVVDICLDQIPMSFEIYCDYDMFVFLS